METTTIATLINRIITYSPVVNHFRLRLTTADATEALAYAYKRMVEVRDKTYRYDDNLINAIRQVGQCLTSDNRQKYGMLLCGLCGNGKTTLLKAIQLLVARLEQRINEEYSKEWSLKVMDATQITNMALDDRTGFEELCRFPLLAIDDLGTEPPTVLYYGSKRCPVAELLRYRYENRLYTIISTNLTPSQIKEVYTERVSDRLNEMATRIVFTGNSFRK